MTTNATALAGARLIEAPPLSVANLTADTLALRLADCVGHPRRWTVAERNALMAEAAHRLWGESRGTDLLTAWRDHFAS